MQNEDETSKNSNDEILNQKSKEDLNDNISSTSSSSEQKLKIDIDDDSDSNNKTIAENTVENTTMNDLVILSKFKFFNI
jgi:hypothetical protein